MTCYPPGNHPYVRDQEYDQRVTLGHDRSSLHQAAQKGYLFMLHSLIEDGARVNITTYNGVTPLHDACSSGHVFCAKKLINAGGQLNAMDIDWHTPMTRACAEGKKECVELLVQSGAKLNMESEQFSPLHCAVAKGCLDSTSILLSVGAEVEKLDQNRLGTPLHAASYCHQTECARLLLQAGASPNTTRPEDEQTPLHVAASTSAPAETITLLLHHGSKLTARDKDGKTALDLAPIDSEAYGVLKHHQENVPLLSELCRGSVNKSLNDDRSSIMSLPLPEGIKAFLDYRK
ncbi:ankyrin repeat and SOCS box protein 11-like [Acanthaster planci]|uniref:Ankyrin repeat and SOCS box protein 11-like n=1 Tax=Acanthaster planci TaxID=133434 RepID=A0A8B7Z8P3_ACAPL|nr:ankyrin repeat and SOCS box protein 11-like [Acanthaster planci]